MAQLTERDAEVARKTDALDEAVAEKTRLAGTLAESKKTVIAEAAARAETERYAEEVTAAMAEHEAGLARRVVEMAAAESEKARLEAALAERSEAVQSTMEKCLSLEKGLVQLNSELVTRTRERDLAQAHAKQIEKIFRESTSWRLTTPIRVVKDGLRAILRGLRAVPTAVRISGGLRSTIGKVLQVYRREGAHGIKERILYAASQGSKRHTAPSFPAKLIESANEPAQRSFCETHNKGNSILQVATFESSRSIFPNFIQYRRMMIGGARALRSGQMSNQLYPNSWGIISHTFLRLSAIMTYAIEMCRENK